MGTYKFENGKLTATFTADSYVAVKEEDNANWYMTDGYPGNDATSALLKNTTVTGENSDKLKVPGNKEVEFTLADNGDGTLTLSYTVAEAPTEPSTEASTAAPTESKTKTITVGIVDYLNGRNDDCYVWYWGGSDGEKDVKVTSTGKTEDKSVGQAYWNGGTQKYYMYTAEVPKGITGFKVHFKNANTWFGDNAQATTTKAYIFEYSGNNNAYYE
jgi:hypothetical protein